MRPNDQKTICKNKKGMLGVSKIGDKFGVQKMTFKKRDIIK